jgi:hypothetical protein
LAGNGGVNGSILQYGGGGLVKKPVMVGKGAVVLSATMSLSGQESSAVEQIWQDWREGHF